MKSRAEPIDWDKPHDVKGLASVLGRSRGYVEDMKTCGFVMVGGRATLRMAFDWLAKHEKFTRGQAARLRFVRREQLRSNGNNATLAKR